MKKNARILLSAAAAAVLAGAVLGGAYLHRVGTYQHTVRDIALHSLSLSEIPDGTYYGECDVDLIAASVAVEVENGKIKSILLLEHRNERGSAAEKVINAIVQKQTFPVDAVTGATNSSKVIQKAVENALTASSDS